MESTTVTALLLLFVVATGDRKEALPATGEVINLVFALQQAHDAPETDTTRRASLIARLSAVLSDLRHDLD